MQTSCILENFLEDSPAFQLIVSSGWAMTPDLIKNGGTAVEGIIISQTINNDLYHGLQGDLRIDQFGDARRKRFVVTVKDGRFKVLE